MGKKVKKKTTRTALKQRRVSSDSHGTTLACSNPLDEIVGDGVFVVKESKPCTHIHNCVDLNKISSKIRSSESVRCEDCREGSLNRRESKRSSKNAKKKGTGSMSTKQESKSIWVCLDCGHFACGGVVLPTTSQSHVLLHARQTRHPCVIQFDNPHLLWCFPCNSLIPVGNSEENVEQKDALLDVVQLIKVRSSGGASIDIEDVWFGNCNGRDVMKIETSKSRVLDGRGGYVVRGLVNLGNTCFFNSVMQNLLAINQLRDYFMQLDPSAGPLTVSLKKLIDETGFEANSINGINPRILFGCICAKAPQFRGYQQQDSHELLRYLLDGLCAEELSARKLFSSSKEDGTTSDLDPPFVDAIFGGQLSSTVCCVECGHTSVVYEPFLDLSLPVPMKKPPAKYVPPVYLPKKSELPLKKEVKKSEMIRGKGKADTAPLLAQCATGTSESTASSSLVPSGMPVNEEETVASLDVFAWLDYIGPDAEPNALDSVSHNYNVSIIQGSESNHVFQSDNMIHNGSESQNQVCSPNRGPKSDFDYSWGNSWEDDLPLQVQSSEVIFLPYKEEKPISEEMVGKEVGASSSTVGYEQDTLDFDGFGDLFNEPEKVSVPNENSWSGDKNNEANGVTETGCSSGNNSEFDRLEVDDTDSPISVDSCLAYFTKPEYLSNEHAWHCENCSKILWGQHVEARENQPKSTLKTQINGGQFRCQNASDLYEDLLSSATELRNLDNGKLESDIGSTTTAERFVSQTERINDSNPNYTNGEFILLEKERYSEFLKATSTSQSSNPESSERDEDHAELNYFPQEVSPAMGFYKSSNHVSFGDQASDSCSMKEPDIIGSNIDQVQCRDSQFLGRVVESDDSVEVPSKGFMVKREATKTLLINSAPPILTIHLKRFSQDSHGRLSKLSGHVGFQEIIDLTPYIDPRSNEKNKYDYHLVGVVEHSGSMRGGHYVAYVRGENSEGKAGSEGRHSTWFYASDAYVHEVSLAEVLRCEAYILFYEKIYRSLYYN